MKRYISAFLAVVMLMSMLPVMGASAARAALSAPVKETFENVQLRDGSADDVTGISSYKHAAIKAAPGRTGSALWLGDTAKSEIPEFHYSFASTDRLTLSFDINAGDTNALGALRIYNGTLSNANTALWLNFNYQGLRYYDGSWKTFHPEVLTTANTWINVRVELTTGADGKADVYFDNELVLEVPAPTSIGSTAATVNNVLFQASNAQKNFYIDNLSVVSTPVAEGFEGLAAGTVLGAPFVDVNMATVQSKANAANGSKMAVYLNDTIANQTAELRYPIADTTALVAEFEVYAVSSVVAFRITNGERNVANSAFWMRLSKDKVEYNNGSWQTLHTLDSSIVGRWLKVRIEANLSTAKLFIDGVEVGTVPRASGGANATTAIDSLVIACGDNTYASHKFYVDNILVVPANLTATVETFDDVPMTGAASDVSGHKASLNAIVTADPVNEGERALYLHDAAGEKAPYFDYDFGAAEKLTVKFDAYIPSTSNIFTFQIYNGSRSTANTVFYLQFNYSSGLRVYNGSYSVINSSVKLEAEKWYEIAVEMTAGKDALADIYVDGQHVGTTNVTCGTHDTVSGFYVIAGTATQSCYIDNLEMIPAVDVTWVADDVTTVESYFVNNMPVFSGIPTKTCTEENHYIFTGWDKEIVAVTEEATYTAQFAPEAHTMGAWQLVVAPGLHTEGEEACSCACGYTMQRSVPALTDSGFAVADTVIRLEKDVVIETLTVDADKVLDLNGYTLNAKNLVSFGSIVDTGNTGKLLVEELILDEMAAMPIYDSANGCYKFFDYTLKSLGVRENANGSVTYGFAINFKNAEAYTLLAAGGSGVDVTMELAWGSGNKMFTIDPVLLQQYAQLQLQRPGQPAAMMLTVTGLYGLEAGTGLQVAPAVKAAGAVATGVPMTYIAKENDLILAGAAVRAESTELGLGETVNVAVEAVYSTNSGVITEGYNVQWRSQTPSIAVVDQFGKVTALGVGSAKIYAIVTYNGESVISEEVVLNMYDRTAPVSMEAAASAQVMNALQNGKITAAAYNHFGQQIEVQWSYESLTPALLTVDNEGDYNALNAGQAEILVTASNGNASVSEKIAITIHPSWDTDRDGVLEILTIGNSFSIDAMEYAYAIAQDLGIEKIVLGNFYVGSCTLAIHANNATNDIGAYTYYYNDNGAWVTTKDSKISTALESRDWDFISLQQGSGSSGLEETYNEDLTTLIEYVKARSNAKLVWHMTWAYQQDSTHGEFSKYNNDQQTMYNGILSAVQKKIASNENFDLIIPNGTAVQNCRTSVLGDTTTRDGYHMNYKYGRYMVGLGLIKAITGLDIDDISYAPFGVSALEKTIAIESVNNALENPFEVTQSSYTEE